MSHDSQAPEPQEHATPTPPSSHRGAGVFAVVCVGLLIALIIFQTSC